MKQHINLDDSIMQGNWKKIMWNNRKYFAYAL